MDGSETGGVAELGTGARIGRFIVLGMVGKGGMGEVYAAFDPDLDRKVAVKLLRIENSAGVDPSEGRARMLREAQAIAKLSDPNVVTVYDVGTFEGRVFLAMEFVDGNTLGYWLHARPRTWREILTCFRAAGLGLAAAHRAGIVHRDFKPDNVMVGHDGNVRVMDFGLARALAPSLPTAAGASGSRGSRAGLRVVEAASRAASSLSVSSSSRARDSGHVGVPSTPSADSSTTSGIGERTSSDSPAFGGNSPHQVSAPADDASDVALDDATMDLARRFSIELSGTVPSRSLPLSSPLTESGAMMGTPAYMAPEQFRGQDADARSDQFSFCIALYEALYGKRPFSGRNIDEVTRAVLSGTVRPAPAGTKVPASVRRMVLRGLRVNRDERYPAMEDLLAAMARDPAATRRRWLSVGAVAGVVCLLGVGFWRAEQQQRLRCVGAEDKFQGIWELPNSKGTLSPRKEAIRAAFMATGKRYAADAFTVVMNSFDRYVSSWNDVHRETCEATHVRGDQSPEVLDLRMTCLQDRLAEMSALTSLFVHADGDLVSKAVQAAQGLRSLEPCSDVAALKAVVRPPEDPAVRRAVADVRTHLADAKALFVSGRYKKALPEAERVVEEASRTKYAAVMAEAYLQLGEIQSNSGVESSTVARNLEQAVWLAEESRHDEVQLEAAIDLIYENGDREKRFADAVRWSRFAEAVFNRVGSGQDVLRSWWQNNLGLVHYGQGRLAEALSDFEKAVEIKTRALGAVHWDVALSEANVAMLLNDLGRTDEAIEKNSQALDVFIKTAGTEHPQVARTLANGAAFLLAQGKFDESRKLAQSALAIFERESANGDPALVEVLVLIGRAYLEKGQSRKAREPLERALEMSKQRGDAESLTVVEATFALARAMWDSRAERSRSLELAERAARTADTSPQGQKQKATVEAWLEGRFQSGRQLSLR